MIVTAVLKPSFAPSVNVSYTLTFLNAPNNTIDTIINGIAKVILHLLYFQT